MTRELGMVLPPDPPLDRPSREPWWSGIADPSQSEGIADRRAAFGTLLGTMLGRFAGCVCPDVPSAVRVALHAIAKLVGAEHAFFLLNPEDPSSRIDTCEDRYGERLFYDLAAAESIIKVPLDGPAGERSACIGLYAEPGSISDSDIACVKMIGHAMLTLLERERAEKALRAARVEIEELKRSLQVQVAPPRGEAERNNGLIIGQSAAIRKVLAQAEQVAKTHSTVLLLGETGVGKELVAQTIHEQSACRNRPMIKVNCAGLPSTLVESELFGRERGAYTGALTRQAGRFEVADGSTVLLDEIGELPLELQAKLLRVLQDGRFERLGSAKTIQVNVRVIASTNRDLAAAVRKGTFREDLYYRLAVFPITVPPLRERTEDIPALVWSFVKEFERSGRPMIASIPKRTMELLQAYTWPGNIRELRNVIEHAMIISSGPVLHVEMPKSLDLPAASTGTLQEAERTHILRVLEQAGWHVGGNAGAAAKLGLKPTTLRSKMERLGIQRPKSNGIS